MPLPLVVAQYVLLDMLDSKLARIKLRNERIQTKKDSQGEQFSRIPTTSRDDVAEQLLGRYEWASPATENNFGNGVVVDEVLHQKTIEHLKTTIPFIACHFT